MSAKSSFSLLCCCMAAVALFGAVQGDLFAPVCPPGVSPQLLDCATDCAHQHNSSGGSCDVSGNCICDEVGVYTNTDHTCQYDFDVLHLLQVALPVCHCGFRNTPAIQAFWQGLCELDCQCFHAAETGTCNYDIRQCICHSSDDFVWEHDEERAICFAENVAEAGVCAVQTTLTGIIPPGC